ncbi:uncharacterized protein LOC135703965 [Ochlerotatus camptorhynchus]|uniref:uncharacterized protein LOC135703965 n=1 Tax=Ochlerotatus camptorhynchus TaxID=644619 RepID=UPI0031E0D089
MGAKRENTLVVDFSVLPKRPDASAVQKFMYGELKLDTADASNIQFHNVKNCVYVEMVDAATAKRYFASHHLQHTRQCEKKAYKIPVFVEDEAVNVRIHDLPPKTPNTVMIESMRPYGTHLNLNSRFVPLVYNGVRVVRMKLKQLIPSYLTIDGDTTLITYRNQAKTWSSTSNCNIKPRCGNCAQNHATSECAADVAVASKCANCGGAHQGSDKQCSKREDFKRIRKQTSTNNQPGRRKDKAPAFTAEDFPPLHGQANPRYGRMVDSNIDENPLLDTIDDIDRALKDSNRPYPRLTRHAFDEFL